MGDWHEPGVSDHYRWMLKYPSTVSEHIMTRLRKNNPKEKFDLILDAGCGHGESLKYYLPYFREAIGFDISKEQIDKAKELNEHENISYFVGGEDAFPVKDKSVDLIISSGAVHYMDIKRFVNECKRTLKTNGLVALYCHGVHNLLIENPKSNTDYVSGYEILMEQYAKPIYTHLRDIGHPLYQWADHYKGMFEKIDGIEKERCDNDICLDFQST